MSDQIQLIELWEKILEKLKLAVKPQVYDTWFKTILPVQVQDNIFEIGVQKSFVKDWLEVNYQKILQDMLNSIAPEPLQLKIITLDIKEEEPPANNYTNENVTSHPIKPSEKNETKYQPIDQQFAEEIDSSLNKKYRFDNFVTGGSNNFAHAAAMAVTDQPGRVYNPLFLYGGVGLGKTHLMHAIGNRIKELNPKSKVLYLSSEKFTNELINSISEGKSEEFRQKYRNIDCLLIDDIQFLSKKERTQEEFFHTFNTLYEANKQIIISSDKQPKEIPTIEDRLRSRFEWGLITDIQSPDLETRIAILRKKAMLEKVTIPDEIILLIASRIENNIRELEGALIRVMAHTSLQNLSITMDNAQIALKDIFPEKTKKPVSIEKIQEVVASYYKLKPDDFIVKKRTRNIAFPRQVAMYLCRNLTSSSLPRIGEMFGGRDHTTVLHAYEKIHRERLEDPKLDQIIKDLIIKIQR